MKRIFYLLSIILLLIGLPLSAQETTKRIEPNSGHSVLDDYAGWEEDGGVYYGHGIPYECDWTCEVIGVTPEGNRYQDYFKSVLWIILKIWFCNKGYWS